MATDTDVLIVGGGIAGLTIAWECARGGAAVTLLEAEPRTGGLLAGGAVDGIRVDFGAESFALRTSGVADLIADAALAATMTEPRPGGAHLVFVAEDGSAARAPLPRRAIVGMPADPLAADVVRILGATGATRAAEERARPWDIRVEPDLATLTRERFGAAVTERLVEPLCRSVYSRPAAQVHLSALNPTLWARAAMLGSLTAAVDALAPPTRAGSAVGGIIGGMGAFAEALREAARAAGATIAEGHAVSSVTATAVTTRSGQIFTARSVVVAVGPRATAAIFDLPARTSTAVRLTTAVIRSAALDDYPVGSGVILAPDVPTSVKAMTHVDAKWEWAAADLTNRPHTHVVRLSSRDAEDGILDDPAEIARTVSLVTGREISASDVIAHHVSLWEDAIGADAVLRDAATIAAAQRTIHLAGAVVAGTGLASVIPHARRTAASVLTDLNRTALS